jgi:hypothetical protein
MAKAAAFGVNQTPQIAVSRSVQRARLVSRRRGGNVRCWQIVLQKSFALRTAQV